MSQMMSSIDTDTEDLRVDPEVLSRELVLVKANRASFASSHTLKRITQKCIVAHKELFCNLAKLQPNTNPYAIISNEMKNELMGVAASMQAVDEEEVELQCQMLRLLTNTKTSSFCFPPSLGPENQAAASQLWQSLLNVNPPDLRTLIVQRLSDDSEIWDVRPFLTCMLPIFLQLEILTLGNFECDDFDLGQIAAHLPQLRVLETALSEQVSRQGFTTLAKLSSLEEFLFPLYTETNYYDGPRRRDILELCYEILPQLHAAAYKVTTFYAGRPLHALSTLTSQILSSVTVPHTLQLRYLALDSLNTLPPHISLPKVRVLHLNHPDFEEDQLAPDRFPNLTELNMHFADEHNLMNVVGHGVGQKLRTLRVSLGEITWLDRLLDACPNLCELYMPTSYSPQSESPLRPDTLRNLQTLYISCPNSVFMQSGLLIEIFRVAPNLRSVELIMVPMAEEDLQQLAELLEQGSCLRKLERFKFYRMPRVEVTSLRENRIRDEAIVACGTHCKHLLEFLFVDSYVAHGPFN